MKTDKAVGGFYFIVLTTALVGSVSAAARWLDVSWGWAIAPIVAVELGGVVLMMYAADRQKLGERAGMARLLSGAVAGMAVATNYFGHLNKPGQAYFFAGLSALGYVVYLLMAGAKRRDALRAAGQLEGTTPVYGVWQWLRHPGLTRRARQLAQANAADRLADPTVPILGRTASLAAAAEQVRAKRREDAIASALDRLIRDAAGPVMADIAVHTYDPDEIAQRLAASADYDGDAALLAADLTPAKLAGVDAPDGRLDDDIMAVADVVAPTLSEQVEAAVTRHLAALPMATPTPAGNRPPWRASGDQAQARVRRPAPAINVTVVAPERPTRPATTTGHGGESKPPRKGASQPATTADRVAGALRRKPDMTQEDVAKVLGVGVRTVSRYWTTAKATVNGHDHGKGQ